MILLNKGDSHYNRWIVEKTENFALLAVVGKDYVSGAFGEHWDKKVEGKADMLTKKDLKKFAEEKKAAFEKVGMRLVWAKAASESLFYECDESDIPDDATTETDKFLVFKIDENGNKSISENPIWDKYDLEKELNKFSDEISTIENYWRYKNASRLQELYSRPNGFEIRRLCKTWKSYDVGEPFVYNAKVENNILDAIQEEKKRNGDELYEFVTRGELLERVFELI